jgi:hypothetical protein
MADLVPQIPLVVGTDLTAVTPTATVGDWVPAQCQVLVRNGSGSSITVTVVVPGNDPYGTARPDFTKTVAAGALTSLGGPFPAELGDPAHSSMVNIICSATASVQLFVVSED